MHYLDDFLPFGNPGTSDCQKTLHTAMQEYSGLGVPIAEHKTKGPTQVLTFLGIEVDTGKMKVRLQRLQGEIKLWLGKKSTTKNVYYH